MSGGWGIVGGNKMTACAGVVDVAITSLSAYLALSSRNISSPGFS
jgi:hypothetical protein